MVGSVSRGETETAKTWVLVLRPLWTVQLSDDQIPSPNEDYPDEIQKFNLRPIEEVVEEIIEDSTKFELWAAIFLLLFYLYRDSGSIKSDPVLLEIQERLYGKPTVPSEPFRATVASEKDSV